MRPFLLSLFLLPFAYPCLASTVAIATTTLPSGTVGAPYSAAVNANGGCTPYEWALVSGGLPSGIVQTPSSNTESLDLTGTPSVAGTYSFTVSVTGCGGHVFETTYTVIIGVAGSSTSCAPPTYSCALRGTSVVPLPSPLPNWGGLYGAGTVFNEPTFNSDAPPQYVRVTDGQSADVAVAAGQAGAQYSGFAVGSGSGDDAHFNVDDSLFTITDNQDDYYVYGLNQSNMQTGLVWFTYYWENLIWSQVNRNYAYGVAQGPGFWRLDFTNCYLGGPTCTPAIQETYDFTNCNFPAGYSFWVNAGIGGSDTVFAGAVGAQDTDNRIFVYNASSNTCYSYNTRFGTVRSYTGTGSPVTGTVMCNGTTTLSGTGFGTGPETWAGASISIGTKVFQIASVQSATALTLGYPCPSGTYSMSLLPGTYIGSVTTTDRYSVHDIRMDPAGTWLIVEEGSYCYSGGCNVIHAWQIGTSTVNSCIWSGSNDPGACDGHYTETASGWINDDGSFLNRQVSMQFRPWSEMSTTDPSNVTELNTNTVNMNGLLLNDHPSTKNDPLGTHGYPVLSSTYTNEATVGAITAPYSNEIVGWTQTPGPVLRFGHTFNSALENPGSQFTSWIAIGAASATGRFYLFTTDGEGTLGNTDGSPNCEVLSYDCRSDVFILSLSPPN